VVTWGKAAGLVKQYCNTEAMAAHLTGISRHIASGAQALLILDQPGWHASAALDVTPTSDFCRCRPNAPS